MPGMKPPPPPILTLFQVYDCDETASTIERKGLMATAAARKQSFIMTAARRLPQELVNYIRGIIAALL